MAQTKIEIKFTCGAKKKQLFVGPASYRSNNTKTDTLYLYNKSAIIDSNRTSGKGALLKAHNSTLYKQVIKAVCLYYVLEQVPRPLREITIVQTYGKTDKRTQVLHRPDIKQVVSTSANLTPLSNVIPSKATLLLEETERGRAVLYATTHLIRSLDSTSVFDRFERLWRSFNALYRALARQNTDHACHRLLRDHIQLTPALFPLSLHLMSPLTSVGIRSHLRWNEMILNNHATVNRAGALRDSIIRVHDHRILEMYKDSLPIRQRDLAAIGALPDVQAHITKYTTARTVRHSDVLSTLCVKYMYFVRNKIAHAERADYGFSFLPGAADEQEIEWLIPFLEALVIDLLNIADTF